jgi:hypothetical protein
LATMRRKNGMEKMKMIGIPSNQSRTYLVLSRNALPYRAVLGPMMQ